MDKLLSPAKEGATVVDGTHGFLAKNMKLSRQLASQKKEGKKTFTGLNILDVCNSQTVVAEFSINNKKSLNGFGFLSTVCMTCPVIPLSLYGSFET